MCQKQGIELAGQGKLQQAVDFFRKAIALKSDYYEAYNNLGVILAGLKLLDEAANAFREAIRLQPDNPDIYNNLGAVLKELGSVDEAEDCLRRGIKLKSNFPDAYNNLGLVLKETYQLGQAEECLRQAILLQPDFPEAYNNLGLVLQDDNRLDEAEASLRQAIKLRPYYSEAYNNLGLVLTGSNHLDEAEICLRHAIELQSYYFEAHNNLGLVLKKNNRFTEAEACFRHAIELKADYAEAYHNLGLVLTDTNRLEEAKASLNCAIELRPNYTEANFLLGFIYLLQGNYAKGWEKFELRGKLLGCYQPPIPCWQGEDLTSRSIVLNYEQGFGDTIQFIRYVREVAALAAKTVVLVQKPLERLLADSQEKFTVITDDNISWQDFDFACPLPSLPYRFNTCAETIPNIVPYIHASHGMASKWQKKINKADGGCIYRIGVVWAGNAKHINDKNRSIPLDVFNTLFDVDNISWVSLQVGKDPKRLMMDEKVLDLSQDLADFSETAGVIENLDLVISVDSAVAHLAGAMGKKMWLLVPFAADWRWKAEGEDTPWYPTMQLFRQSKFGDWQEVLDKIKVAIQQELLNNH
jgi:Flp pilus assembly protein TadD